MSEQAQHTPLPWCVEIQRAHERRGGEEIPVDFVNVTVGDKDHEIDMAAGPPIVARMWANGRDAEAGVREANARLIVRAVNAHADMLAELERVADVFEGLAAGDDDPAAEEARKVRAVIANAKGCAP